jgi:hypothetical protein
MGRLHLRIEAIALEGGAIRGGILSRRLIQEYLKSDVQLILLTY